MSGFTSFLFGCLAGGLVVAALIPGMIGNSKRRAKEEGNKAYWEGYADSSNGRAPGYKGPFL